MKLLNKINEGLGRVKEFGDDLGDRGPFGGHVGWLGNLIMAGWSIYFLIGLIIMLCSCTPGISISTNPDYSFAPTDPASITQYNGFTPSRSFIIIGKITLSHGPFSVSDNYYKNLLRKKVAAIGADAIVITDSDIDIYAYNRYVYTYGQASITGNTMSFYTISHPVYTGYAVTRYYGYLIRFN